jgi:hypothetical protein
MAFYTFPVTTDSLVSNVNLFRIQAFRSAFYWTRGKANALTLEASLNSSSPTLNTQLFFYTENEVQQWPAGLDLSRLVRSGPLAKTAGISSDLFVSSGKLMNMSDFVSSDFRDTGLLSNMGIIFNQLAQVTNNTSSVVFLPIVLPNVFNGPFLTGNIVFTDSQQGDSTIVGWQVDPLNAKRLVLQLDPFNGTIDPTATKYFWNLMRYPFDLSTVETTPLTFAQIFNGAKVNIGAMQIDNPYYGPTDRFFPSKLQGCGISTAGFVDYSFNTIQSVCQSAVDALTPGLIAPSSPFSTAILPEDLESKLSLYVQKTMSADQNTMASVPFTNTLTFPIEFVFPDPQNAPDVFYMKHTHGNCEMILRRARNLGEPPVGYSSALNPLSTFLNTFNPSGPPDSSHPFNNNGYGVDDPGVPSGLQAMPVAFYEDPVVGFQLDNFTYSDNQSLLDELSANLSLTTGANQTFTRAGTQYSRECDAARFRMYSLPSTSQVTLQHFDLGLGGGRADIEEEAFLNDFASRRRLPFMEVMISTLPFNSVTDIPNDFFTSGSDSSPALTTSSWDLHYPQFLVPFLLNNTPSTASYTTWCHPSSASGSWNKIFHRTWATGIFTNCDPIFTGALDYTFTYAAFAPLTQLLPNSHDQDCFPGLLTGVRYGDPSTSTAAQPRSKALPTSRFVFNMLFDQPGQYVRDYFNSKDALDSICCVSRNPPLFCRSVVNDNGIPMVYGTPTCNVFMNSFCASKFEPTNVPSCTCMYPPSSNVPGLPIGVDYCFSSACHLVGYLQPSLKLNQVCSSSICASAVNITGSNIVFNGQQTLACGGAVQNNVATRDDFPEVPGLVGQDTNKTSLYKTENMVPVMGIMAGIVVLLCLVIIIVALFKKPQRVVPVPAR